MNDAAALEPHLTVRISKAANIIWEGIAKSVSSKNSNGPFDILPYHTNFITFMEDSSVRVIADSIDHEFKFNQAVLYVQNNIVHVYTDI